MVRLFKKKQDKISKRDKFLLEEYEKGKVLQIDGKTDNKEYFKSLEVKNEPKEESE